MLEAEIFQPMRFFNGFLEGKSDIWSRLQNCWEMIGQDSAIETQLIGGLVAICYFPIHIGFLSSSQLTFTHIFQRGKAQAPTSQDFSLCWTPSRFSTWIVLGARPGLFVHGDGTDGTAADCWEAWCVLAELPRVDEVGPGWTLFKAWALETDSSVRERKWKTWGTPKRYFLSQRGYSSTTQGVSKMFESPLKSLLNV